MEGKSIGPPLEENNDSVESEWEIKLLFILWSQCFYS
jgi:hypothetical protein